jgi:hypothetical protein
MSYTVDQLADMVEGVLANHSKKKPGFTQIAAKLTDYVAMRFWLKKEQIKVGSGKEIDRSLMYKTSGQAKFTGLYEPDVIKTGDHGARWAVPYALTQTHWAFDVQEPVLSRGRAQIYDHIIMKQYGALLDLVEMLEEAAWTLRTSTEVLKPNGIPYYVVFDSTAADGFNGKYPSGFTTMGGLDLDVVTNFKNWMATYTNVTEDDLLEKMCTAHWRTLWRSPISIDDYRSWGQRRRIYTSYVISRKMERLAEARNENLGPDLAAMETMRTQTAGDLSKVDGTVCFKRHPIIPVPQLSEDTLPVGVPGEPVYMIDDDSWKTNVKSGINNRRTILKNTPGMHLVTTTFYDSSIQWTSENRRANAVFSTD